MVVHAKSGRKLDLRRDRAVRRDARQGAGDHAGSAQEAGALPPDRQGHDARRAAEQGQRQRDNTRSTCRCRACSTATVLRAPVEGSSPDRIDEAKAQGDPRRRRSVIGCRYGVGVLAETPRPRSKARQALIGTVTWTRTGTARGFDSDKGIDEFARRARSVNRAGARLEPARQRAAATPKRRNGHRSRVPQRLHLSRADGAAERGRRGVARRATRPRSGAARRARPWRRKRRQGARHRARQGQAERHADGRRFRPPRPSRRGVHHRRGADVEGGRPAGQGDVDARGRRPQRPLPSALGALSARRPRCRRQDRRLASSHRGRPRPALRRSGALPRDRRRTASSCAAPSSSPTTSRISWSSSSTATPACAPRRCAASASPPTCSPPKPSWTRWRANATSIRSRSASSC